MVVCGREWLSVVGCGCLQWGEVVYGRECGCLSLVGRSCLRLVEVVCSGEWFSPPLLPSTAASTTASLSTAALSPCCPIHRNLISRSRGPINCRLIQRFRTGQMSNSPRGVVGAGSRYERQSTGSVSYSSPPLTCLLYNDYVFGSQDFSLLEQLKS